MQIIGYELTVKRGERAGLVRRYGPDQGTRARRFADRLDNEYGAICASVRPIFAAATKCPGCDGYHLPATGCA
jgi:hypothetical protein